MVEVSKAEILGGTFLVIMMALGLFIGGAQFADIAQEDPEEERVYEGELVAHGLEVDDIESPFDTENTFNNIVPAEADDEEEAIVDGSYGWEVQAEEDLSLTERTVLNHFEVEGDLEGLEIEYVESEAEDALDSDDARVTEAVVYDYDAAVDNNDLDVAQVDELDRDGIEAEAELGTVTEGEYGILMEFSFESGTEAGTDTDHELNLWNMEADTGEDLDTLEDIPNQVEAEAAE